MRLYVIRHADAVRVGGTVRADAERTLSERGVRDAARLASFLGRMEPELGALLTSPLRRAVQTAEAIGRAGGYGIRPRTTESLAPGFRPRALLQEVLALGAVPAVALVGHQPDLATFVSFLTTDTLHAAIHFPPASLAMVTVSGAPDHTQCSLSWLVPPDLLERGFNHQEGA
jgi:phosphohistidine phosphatase